MKIPFNLICIVESIRDMSVDISYRRRPGAKEDLCMPVILQLLLTCLSECHVASFQTLSK